MIVLRVIEHRVRHIQYPLVLFLVEFCRNLYSQLVTEGAGGLQPLVAHEIIAPAAHAVFQHVRPVAQVVGFAEPHHAEREQPVHRFLHPFPGFIRVVPVKLGPEHAVAHVEPLFKVDLSQGPAVRRKTAMQFDVLGPMQAGAIQQRLHDDKLDIVS